MREDTARRGGTPSQLGHKGFPAAVCTSPNAVVCHGIPRRDVVLRPGDIVNVDVTTCLDGFHGDTSATFFIGEPSPEARRVVDVARRCREAGIAVVRELGGREVRFLDDGWTVVTADGSLSAQFEHTVLVTRDACEILTAQSDVAREANPLDGSAPPAG